MPYFITDKSPDCSGWATIKEDGEVIGCHTTKQDAIDQMVAISIAEDITPGGERLLSGPKAIIIDIDDTIIRLNGEPIEDVIEYVNNLVGSKFIITARLESRKDETLEELKKIDMPYTRIFFKEDSDEDSADYKKRIAEQLLKVYYVYEAIDNDPDMRQVYRSLRIKTTNPASIDQVRELRASPSELKIGDYVSWNSSGGRARGEVKRIERDGQINVPDSDFVIVGSEEDPAALIAIYERYKQGWRETDTLVAHKFSTLTKIDPLPEPVEDEDEDEDSSLEKRQVDLSVPVFMRAAARRGLKYHEEGLSGDGLKPETVREANDLAEGRATEAKWRKIAPWIARHLVDLDAPKNKNPNDPQYPGAGLVAHLLWGSGPSKASAVRAMNYAQRIIDRLDAEADRQRWSNVSIQLKKEQENKVTKIERRVKNDINFELRIDNAESDGMRFTGYAAVFNSDSEPLPFIERIIPGAFKRSLKSRNEIKMFMNHNMDHVLASTKARTLKLTEDSKGLLAEAELPDTSTGRDLAVLMKRGDVHAMSFGFSVPPRGDKWSEDGMTRELHQIRLHEVSIVTGFPAYEATTANVRSLDILATRTNVDVDQLADALLKLEAGETLPNNQADLISEVVTKLRENQPSENDLLGLKRQQLDLLFKAI